MDDGMLGGEMTLDGIGRQLATIQGDLSAMKHDMASLTQELTSMRTDLGARMLSVLDRVDGLDHRMTVEFEQVKGLLRFGLEAREALRETMEQRFAEADHKHDEQIVLLKDVLRSVGA